MGTYSRENNAIKITRLIWMKASQTHVILIIYVVEQWLLLSYIRICVLLCTNIRINTTWLYCSVPSFLSSIIIHLHVFTTNSSLSFTLCLSLSLSLSLFLSLCLFVSIYIYLSLTLCLFLSISLCLYFSLSLCLYFTLSLSLSLSDTPLFSIALL